ncbi:MAG: hypothetical protein GYB31_05675 [Bacteroidetes bacterium]|nr:hypothetical protein [Bacteroidota bacterium]
MNPNTLSSREILLDIGAMRQLAKGLVGQGKPYDRLLVLLLEKDYYEDDDEPIPSMKELSEKLSLSYEKVRKQIKQIYDDLVFPEGEELPSFSIKNVKYIIYVHSLQKSMVFELDNLPVLPRVGEQFEVPFFHAYLGFRDFFVKSITHRIVDDCQEISISLKYGYYNLYWHYRRDKAWEEQELGIQELANLDDYELRRRLGVGR